MTLKSQQNSVSQIFNLSALSFFPFDMCYMILPCYLHSIPYFALCRGYEDDIFRLFLICTFKNPNLSANLTFFFLLHSAEFMEFFFFKSAVCALHNSKLHFTIFSYSAIKTTIHWEIILPGQGQQIFPLKCKLGSRY